MDDSTFSINQTSKKLHDSFLIISQRRIFNYYLVPYKKCAKPIHFILLKKRVA